MSGEPRCDQVFFDPDKHPVDTLKAFEEFVELFELRYDAQFPDPPKVSMDAALQRWAFTKATDEIPNPKPSLDEYDEIREEWRSKDKVAKLLGMYSSKRFHADWRAAKPEERSRKVASWDMFIESMRQYYKPTENTTLKNFQFRTITQLPQETFPAFCNRVYKEAQHCEFKCDNDRCTAEEISIRDQIIIGTHCKEIREEALRKSWDLVTLRKEGMQMESAARGGAEIGGESIDKVGKYSYGKMKDKKKEQSGNKKPIICFNCGYKVNGSIMKHKETCPAKEHTCKKCGKKAHFEQVCKNKNVNRTKKEDKNDNNEYHQQSDSEEESAYNVNLFRVKTTNKVKPTLKPKKNDAENIDFKAQVVVNNNVDTILSDTGAKISVCGTVQAKKWNLLSKMVPSKTRIKPYNSPSLPVYGEARCAVSFGESSVPVNWHIISGSCEPILSGKAALQLGIITFNKNPGVFEPVLMIDSKAKDKDPIQEILAKYPENFAGIGKLKNHEVKFHTKENVKPVCVPPRSFPYHLKERAQKAIDEMINEGIIEEHPADEPAPWVSNSVLAPKPDGKLRVTLDARNVNKAIEPSKVPIPRHEDIKAKLAGCKVFSKLDFKSAFWQIALAEESRNLTVFHANDRLYRYKRLTMGMKPAQGELTAALRPIFANIKGAFLIHDDLILATVDTEDHLRVIKEVMEAIAKAGLTLNPAKCSFGKSEISFWGMIYGADGVRPDPAKVEALDHITAPVSKSELISFLCMMQSNAAFIANFAKQSAPLRELTRGKIRFRWEKKHQLCFEMLIGAFRKDALLRYFDLSKPTYVFTDAHITGLGAMLAQGDTKENAKPVAFASRRTGPAETNYPQLDLEAMGIDFGLRRFRNYLVGSPTQIRVVTDHKPLCPIFNKNRPGSIRTDKIRMRHQDIDFEVSYQKGSKNQTDYISRKAKALALLSKEEIEETEELNNLLYMLHVTPIMDHIGISEISKATSKDEILIKLKNLIMKGQTWIPKAEDPKLLKFKGILPELTITGNGIILKGERIVLPEKLQTMAIELAHRGSHPGISGLERRLRYHFFFHDLQRKVKEAVKSCEECNIFTDKKTSEPIIPHKVPKRCWDTVAVDLFGPMPSSKHVIVVQDLASRYPAAKIVTSTSADKVIPAMADIYDIYGNPRNQLSDNGPPFNSKAMTNFAAKRDINVQKIPPLHAAANPSETFMKPLGKTMKIARHQLKSEKEALQELLDNYRDTPHPATGITPSAMLFRDGVRKKFPCIMVDEKQVKNARERDARQKLERGEKINASNQK